MQFIGTDQLIKILQMSIAPVALVSGVGLLLLSMTNRLGRTIDRTRELSERARAEDKDEQERVSVQIRILYRRSKILRASIILAALSILLTSVIVFCLFAMYLFHARLHVLVLSLWTLGIGCLVLSLVFFIHDITLNLQALGLIVREHVGTPPAE